MIPLSPFLAWGLVTALGPGILWAVGPMIMFVVVPLIDLIRGVDRSGPPDEVLAALDRDRYYRWCTYLFLPLQYGGLIVACHLWTTAAMGWPERLALALTVGIVGGVAINAAHELGHKRTSHEPWFAKLALAQSVYGHFYVEHNHGHHVRVATPDDPASARYGESFWHFLPRSIAGGVRSGWTIERTRLCRRGRRWFSPRNNVLNAWAMSAVLYGALLGIFGWSVLPWLAVQAVVAITMLESANYIEHYGLLRETRTNGSFVPVAPRHSWNSDHVWSNLFLYHLQRHSDHHTHAGRRYQSLRSAPEAAQLPAGYAAMGLLATIPPLWRRVMDPRLLAHYGGDLGRIHTAPAGPARTRGTAGRVVWST
ncbi:alkane 1-monooxygenase [Gordonia sinesedis]